MTIEGGRLGAVLTRDSLFERFVRRFLKDTPRTYTVKFDDYGSFVWSAIDGRRSTLEIAHMLCERFAGDMGESETDGINLVCARLCKFIGVLRKGGLVNISENPETPSASGRVLF
ncbi:MAG: PqqD family protein [Synergistaceae bacterium]|nr:PqqD family protein [Synergistaceae bacterium]